MGMTREELLEARRLLTELGYGIAGKSDGFSECLVRRAPSESWLGRGVDEDDAFEDALHKAFPSAAAWQLFIMAIERSSSPLLEAVRRTALGRSATVSSAQAGPFASSAASMSAQAEDTPSKTLASAQERVFSSFAPESAASFAPLEARVVRQIDREAALRRLDELDAEIAASRSAFAASSDLRQRILLREWIAAARAAEEIAREDIVVERVEAIARVLGKLAKAFWPGSVRALQIAARPQDVHRELGGRGAPPDTWGAVAVRTADMRRELLEQERRRGFDRDGWADAAMVKPAPKSPLELFDEVVEQIESVGGALSDLPNPEALPSVDQMGEWIATARWLRGSVDAEVWGSVMGRLRHWVHRHRTTFEPIAQWLDANYAPAQPWASVAGNYDLQRRREQQDLDKRREREEREPLARAVLDEVPSTRATREAVVDWLARVLPFADTHHDDIVKSAETVRDIVLTLGPDDLPPEAGRRERRRLDKVKRDLSGETEPTSSELELDEGDGESDGSEQDEDRTLFEHEELRLLVAQHTRGKNAVFISNRQDPDLRERLLELLELSSLEWTIGDNPRRAASLSRSVAGSGCDLVLSATGLLDHSLDERVFGACKRAGVPYIRVERGRPLTCLRALGDFFGVEIPERRRVNGGGA